MTREQAKELLPIIQAFADGKDIQYQGEGDTWLPNDTLGFSPSWKYRIKPQPREFWVVEWRDLPGDPSAHSIHSTKASADEFVRCLSRRVEFGTGVDVYFVREVI